MKKEKLNSLVIFRITDTLAAALARLTKQRRISRSAFIRSAVAVALDQARYHQTVKRGIAL